MYLRLLKNLQIKQSSFVFSRREKYDMILEKENENWAKNQEKKIFSLEINAYINHIFLGS